MYNRKWLTIFHEFAAYEQYQFPIMKSRHQVETINNADSKCKCVESKHSQLDSQRKRVSNIGKPSGIGKPEYQLPPSNTWASNPNCQYFVAYLTKLRIFEAHITKTKKGNQQSKEQLSESAQNSDEIGRTRSRSNDKKCEKGKIMKSLENLAKNHTNAGVSTRCIVFFFNSQLSDQQIKNNEDINYNGLTENQIECLMKIKPLLHPIWMNEMIEILKTSNHDQNINNLFQKYFEQLSQQRQLKMPILKNAHTFLQFLFIKHLYNTKSAIVIDQADAKFLAFVNKNLDQITKEFKDAAAMIHQCFPYLESEKYENYEHQGSLQSNYSPFREPNFSPSD